MKLLKEFETAFKNLRSNNDWRNRDALELALKRTTKATRVYQNNITGDAAEGDKILFIKQIWERKSINRYGKMANVIVDYALIEAEILRESYGKDKGQHTFTLKVQNGETMFIKGRNLYAVGVWAKKRDKKEREEVLADKHARGAKARAKKQTQREERYCA